MNDTPCADCSVDPPGPLPNNNQIATARRYP
jgi:hypothetical protein